MAAGMFDDSSLSRLSFNDRTVIELVPRSLEKSSHKDGVIHLSTGKFLSNSDGGDSSFRTLSCTKTPLIPCVGI